MTIELVLPIPAEDLAPMRTIWVGRIDGQWSRMMLPTVLPGKEWRMPEEIQAGVPLWAGDLDAAEAAERAKG